MRLGTEYWSIDTADSLFYRVGTEKRLCARRPILAPSIWLWKIGPVIDGETFRKNRLSHGPVIDAEKMTEHVGPIQKQLPRSPITACPTTPQELSDGTTWARI